MYIKVVKLDQIYPYNRNKENQKTFVIFRIYHKMNILI